jgi:hypothetical protein
MRLGQHCGTGYILDPVDQLEQLQFLIDLTFMISPCTRGHVPLLLQSQEQLLWATNQTPQSSFSGLSFFKTCE